MIEVKSRCFEGTAFFYEENMNDRDQTRAPLYEALERLRRKRVVPFDVPGHKRGRGNPELVALL